MGSPSKDQINVEDALRVVIQNLIDAQEGFQKIAEELKDETLKRFCLAESLKRAEFRGELETILHQEGVRDIDESGSAAAAFVRAWTGFTASLGAGSASLLRTAHEAEDETLRAYTDALAKDPPLPIREVLATQAAHILQSRDAISAAREAA